MPLPQAENIGTINISDKASSPSLKPGFLLFAIINYLLLKKIYSICSISIEQTSNCQEIYQKKSTAVNNISQQNDSIYQE